MHYDVFFSISQTPVDGSMPDEATMFRNFFDQVEAADELGFGTAWVAEAHLSSEVQKTHRKPEIPHWEGEVGLNVDFLQLATRVFQRTRRIECGSAAMNVLCNGGPVAAAERIAAFCNLHGLDPDERRRIHVGFAAGRFDFDNTPTGIRPQSFFEEAFWPLLKSKIFEEAAVVLCHLLRGDTIDSEELPKAKITREDVESDEEWDELLRAAGSSPSVESIELAHRWKFEATKIVPRHWRRELLRLVIGSQDPRLQRRVNEILPVDVFDLSITRPEVIGTTHERMRAGFHPGGGPWKRSHMPRVVSVFVNGEPGLSPGQQRAAARGAARAAMGAYWTALEGRLDPKQVEKAAADALVGNPQDVAEQVVERFHPDDRLMLWFDVFDHDNHRAIRNMEVFMREVAPRVAEAVSR